MVIIQVSCHGNSCSSEERNVATRTNHMCLGINVNMISSLESSEESSSFEDDTTLTFRLKRLYKRIRSMYRRMKRLKKTYINVRQVPSNNLTGFIDRHPCLGPLEFRGKQSLSTERSEQLLSRLGRDYYTLTTMVGVLRLMQNDEEEYQQRRSLARHMVSVRVTTERVICELFLTIRKLQTNLLSAGTVVDNHVPENGLYTPIVRAWCSVNSGNCRHERDGVILTQLLKFANVLRRNYNKVWL
ncbi:uncharacterized protein [Argopecten irradians]|uniref:uncharacterized protein n=1 Tax=Argopecten irradians TaxID=31199 RepID=UPI00371BDF78